MYENAHPQMREALLSALEKIADWLYEQSQNIRPLTRYEHLHVKVGENKYIDLIIGVPFCYSASSSEMHKNDYCIGYIGTNNCCCRVYCDKTYGTNGKHQYYMDGPKTRNDMLENLTIDNFAIGMQIVENWDKVKQAILNVFELDKDKYNKINSFNPNNGCTD